MDIFDICDIKPNIGINIIGTPICKKPNLLYNIMFVLRKKYCDVNYVSKNTYPLHCKCIYQKKSYPYNTFYINVYDDNIIPKLKCNITFMSIKTNDDIKQKIYKYYYKNLLCYDTINYDIPDTFIILQKKQLPKICYLENPETFFLYSSNAHLYYDKNNILINKIKNGYSIYHNIDGKIYNLLLEKLKKLKHMHYIYHVLINNVLLPTELKIYILKMYIFIF